MTFDGNSSGVSDISHPLRGIKISDVVRGVSRRIKHEKFLRAELHSLATLQNL